MGDLEDSLTSNKKRAVKAAIKTENHIEMALNEMPKKSNRGRRPVDDVEYVRRSEVKIEEWNN